MDNIKTFICPGHGNYSPKGAPDGSFPEWKGNREIAHILERAISNSENIIGTSPIDIPLKVRVDYVNKYKGDSIFLDLHTNASTNSGWGNARGHVQFYHVTSEKSKLLAECINNRMDELSPLPNRGIKKANWMQLIKGRWVKMHYLYNLRKTKMPGIISEIGFHDNKEDLAIIKSCASTHSLAHALGVEDYREKVKELG